MLRNPMPAKPSFIRFALDLAVFASRRWYFPAGLIEDAQPLQPQEASHEGEAQSSVPLPSARAKRNGGRLRQLAGDVDLLAQY
jgi:hypothetical protein